MANPSQPKLIESKLRGSSLNQVISPNSKELELVLSAGGAQGAWQDLEPVFASMSGGWLKASGARAGYLDTVATLKNYGTHPNDGVQGTANSQPVCLAHSGRNYLHLPGVAGNYASAPVGASAAVTSWIMEIDGNFRLNGGDQCLFFGGAFVFINGAGQYVTNGFVGWSELPATGDQILRFVYDGVQIEAFHKVDGVWVSDGATALTGVHNWSGTAWFGSENSGSSWNLRGAYRRVTFWDQLDDSLDPVLDIPFDTFADRATSGVAATGQVVTINQSGGNPAVLVGRPLLYFDGVDDFFGVSGLVMPVLSTFVYVIKPTDKAPSPTWNNGGPNYTMVATGGDAASPEDFDASSWNYRLNSVDLGALSRDGVYDNFWSVRSLAVTTATRVFSESIDLKFSGYPAGYMFQGYVEALYVYDRILDAGEIAKLETYMLARYGPF